MSEILLVRHAEPALRGVILGASDCPLSPRGHEQALALSRKLPPAFEGAVLYASPLRRALQTASYLLRPWRGCAILRGLREVSYGPWDGLTWQQIEALHPEWASRKANDWLGVDVPGAEPWGEFRDRVLRCLDAIRRGPLPAIVVSHQAVHAVLVQEFEGDTPISFSQAYAEWRKVSV